MNSDTQTFAIDACEEAFVRDFCPYKGSPDPLIVWRSAWAAALAATKPAGALPAGGEPVAWLAPDIDEAITTARKENWETSNGYGGKLKAAQFTQPLFAAPQPAQEPLTDEQIDKLLATSANLHWLTATKTERLTLLIRTVERAHGIKPKD